MRRALLGLAALCCLLPAPAGAGGTGVTMTLVPVPAQCSSLGGYCTNDSDVSCSIDADCSVGSLDPRSKLSFGGKKGVVKATLRGVTNALGETVTTDGAFGTDDDYVLIVHFSDCDYANVIGCDDAARLEQGVPLKVELKDGKAKLNVDVSGFLAYFGEGRALKVRGADLRLPTSPPACPGDNSPAGIDSRSYESCQGAPHLGFTGILVGQ